MKTQALLLFVLTLSLSANGLDDLKAALGRMQGKSALRGIYEVKAWSKGGKGKDIEETTGIASSRVEDDASGLQIRWEHALLSRAEAEVKPQKGTHPVDSPSLGIDSASAVNIHAAVHFAPKLLRLLGGAQLRQEQQEPYQGHLVRVLELQLMPPSSELEDHPQEHRSTARIWLGPDGLPLAAALADSLKTSKWFVSMEMNRTEDYTFAHAADRLVVIRKEERMATKALGIEAQQHLISTFTAQ